MGEGGQRGHLGDEPHDLAHADLGVGDVLRLGIEGRQGADGGHEDAHGVGVVVEAVHEPLPDVLVDVGVEGDVVRPLLELRPGRELAVDDEVGDLQVARLLGQVLDGVAPVAEDAVVAVEVGDRAATGRRLDEGGVVDEDVGIELAQRPGRDPPVLDRDLDALTCPVVDDRVAVGHANPLALSRTVIMTNLGTGVRKAVG